MANICYRYHNTLCPWQTPVAHHDSPFLIKSGYNPHHVLGNYYQPNGVGVSADTHLLLLPERVVRISRWWIHSAWNIMMTITWEHVTPARAWGVSSGRKLPFPLLLILGSCLSTNPCCASNTDQIPMKPWCAWDTVLATQTWAPSSMHVLADLSSLRPLLSSVGSAQSHTLVLTTN